MADTPLPEASRMGEQTMTPTTAPHPDVVAQLDARLQDVEDAIAPQIRLIQDWEIDDYGRHICLNELPADGQVFVVDLTAWSARYAPKSLVVFVPWETYTGKYTRCVLEKISRIRSHGRYYAHYEIVEAEGGW